MARYTPNIFSFMRLECELLAMKMRQKVSYSFITEGGKIRLQLNGNYYAELAYSSADDVMETDYFKLFMFRGIKHRAFAKTVFIPVRSEVFNNVWIDIRNYLEVFFVECIYS